MSNAWQADSESAGLQAWTTVEVRNCVLFFFRRLMSELLQCATYFHRN